MFAQKPSKPGMVGGLLAFIGMSAVASVLIAAAVTPAIAVTGVAGNSTLGIFEDLPTYLEINDLSEKSSVYAKAADGSDVLLASFYAQNRITVPLDEISPYVVDGAIATEDPRFYEHGGIDLIGTGRALLSNATGGDVQGGSSISQQYVKNILVMRAEEIADPEERKAAYAAATETSIERKLKEMKLAVGVEKKYSKDEILNGYLNVVSFGGRVYGIEAASEYYYGVKAKDLTLAQAASLIATVQNPNNLRIDIPENLEANKARRDYVLSRMASEGKITDKERDAAIAEPITPVITPSSTGCQTAGNAAFFCDYVTWVIKNDKAFGDTEEERWAAFQRGGWKIMTTLDLDMQNTAQAAIDERVARSYAEGDIASSAVSVQLGTGRILTMAQSKDYSSDPEVLATGNNFTSVNYGTDSKYGGSTGFPVGSTYKVFTLAEWLKSGHGLNDTVNGQVKTWKMSEFKDRCVGVGGPDWRPLNYSGGGGTTTTALRALINSYNINFITMASKMDLCDIKELAQSFGVHRADGADLGSNPSTIIGTNEIAPLTMAVATAGIMNQGKTCSAVAIDSIVDHTGKEIKPPQTKCVQSVPVAVANTLAYAMQQVPTGTAAQTRIGDGIDYGAKTGTSDNVEQNWVMGATTSVATVVWTGNVTGHTSLLNVPGFGRSYSNIVQHVWREIMRVANGKYGGNPFAGADANMIKGKSISVPAIKGLTAAQAKDLIESVGLEFKDGGEIDSELPKGTVVRSDPESGSATGVGSMVTVYTSNQSLVAGPANVVGRPSAQAQSELQAAGWVVSIVTKPAPGPTPCMSQPPVDNTTNPPSTPAPVSSSCPAPPAPNAGTVLSQDVVGGFIKPGSTITLTVQG